MRMTASYYRTTTRYSTEVDDIGLVIGLFSSEPATHATVDGL